MTDIALFLSPDGSAADLAVLAGDLATDDGLGTAVILSLLLDAVADADDVLPPGPPDRRGDWGDAYAPALPDGTPDHAGSKLWLDRRLLATTESQRRIEGHIADALRWMQLDGVAARIAVTSQFISGAFLQVTIEIDEVVAGGVAVLRTFTPLWDFTLGQLTF